LRRSDGLQQLATRRIPEPVHILTPYSFQPHFRIILLSTKPPICLFSQRISDYSSSEFIFPMHIQCLTMITLRTGPLVTAQI